MLNIRTAEHGELSVNRITKELVFTFILNKYKIMKKTITSLAILFCLSTNAQSVWTQMTAPSTPFTARNASAGFSIGTKGYFGLGGDTGGETKDFYEYNSITDSWIKKADFGGGKRQAPVSFSIGGKGYVGLGDSSGVANNDFWEYDPTTNIWTKKADFPGGVRTTLIGFSIGNKGYVGLGDDGTGVLKKDFYEYNPITNIWTSKANFGGTARSDANGFSIGNKGYVGVGDDGTVPLKKDFWQYNPSTNTWIQKTDFGGGKRTTATGFSLNNKGYIGAGDDGATLHNDFWEYDTLTNAWTAIIAFPGTKRSDMVGFAIGANGYVGNGNTCAAACYVNDWYKYGITSTGINTNEKLKALVNLFPNPSNGNIVVEYQVLNNESASLIIIDALGNKLSTHQLSSTNNSISIDATNLSNGVYYCEVQSASNIISTQKLIILK